MQNCGVPIYRDGCFIFLDTDFTDYTDFFDADYAVGFIGQSSIVYASIGLTFFEAIFCESHRRCLQKLSLFPIKPNADFVVVPTTAKRQPPNKFGG